MNNLIRQPFKYSYSHVVYWLIGINLLIFAVMHFFGNNIIPVVIRGERFNMSLYDFFYVFFSMRPLTVVNGWVWTFITYMFLHGGIRHILFNMLGLFIFGTHVEKQFGSREFLLYYLLTGALAGVFSFVIYFITGSMNVALVGASGALYAVMFAYAVLFPDSIIYIWGILPLRAPIMVLGFTALSIVFMITGAQGNVAHITHLAGFGFGWLYIFVRFGVNPWRRLTRRY